ncbi:MAG TPA: hypothetical protein VEF06_03015 [Bryobacteraceae bacterium]|nr:hypothetical protein [Bryobacteraceae bacterium]
MKKLSKVITWLGTLIGDILAAHIPLSVWLDSTSLELYRLHR